MKQTPIITLWQPWAMWVALGWKTIETRLHKRLMSLEGRRIGIHAALKWDDNAINTARRWLSETQIKETEKFLKIGGAIICTVFASRHCVLYKPSDSAAALCECEVGCGVGERYGLFLRDVQSIEAIPCKGRQGIWYYDIPIPTPRPGATT